MENFQVKKFIKLGTAVRYLNDVKYKMSDKWTADEPLGDGHVLDNMKIVLNLVDELQLEGTRESGAYDKLKKFLGELNLEHRKTTTITLEQAERLHELSRILRGSLLCEGNNIITYYLDDSEVSSLASPGWPEKITPELLAKTPIALWAWFVGLLAASFILGITVSETGLYGKVKDLTGFERSSVEPSVEVESESKNETTTVSETPEKP